MHVGDNLGRIAGPTLLRCHRQWPTDDFLNRRHHVADREASAVPAVKDQALAALVKIVQSSYMGFGQVTDMNEVADTCAVGRGVVGAIDRQPVTPAQRSLARDLDQMPALRTGEAGAAVRISAGNIKIAQDHMPKPMRASASPNIHSVISFERPYGFSGIVGASSGTGSCVGWPYTAAVEENTKCRIPASVPAPISARLASVLLR